MFREIRASDCALEQARLGLVHLCAMFEYVSLLLFGGERSGREFLSDVLEAYAEKKDSVILP